MQMLSDYPGNNFFFGLESQYLFRCCIYAAILIVVLVTPSISSLLDVEVHV